jgi:hypothetical protein
MAMAKWNDTQGSSRIQKVAWTGAASDYNILENGPSGSVGCQVGYCCRAIIVGAPTGPIVVKDGEGNTVTIPLAILQATPYLPIQLQALVAAGSSGATIMILW